MASSKALLFGGGGGGLGGRGDRVQTTFSVSLGTNKPTKKAKKTTVLSKKEADKKKKRRRNRRQRSLRSPSQRSMVLPSIWTWMPTSPIDLRRPPLRLERYRNLVRRLFRLYLSSELNSPLHQLNITTTNQKNFTRAFPLAALALLLAFESLMRSPRGLSNLSILSTRIRSKLLQYLSSFQPPNTMVVPKSPTFPVLSVTNALTSARS